MDLDQLEWEEKWLVREIDRLQSKLAQVRAEYRAKLDEFSEKRAAALAAIRDPASYLK